MEKKYQQIPECLPYHPLSELKDRQGYYPNISPEQLTAASQLSKMIEAEGLNFNHDEENEFLKLLRFLRARKFDVAQAFHMVKEDVKWRSEENRYNLRKETAQEVLECDLGKIYKYFPTWIQGVDKQLRPVSYRQFGKFEIWNVLKLTTMSQLIRFHAWETEQALRSMYKYSRQHGYNIETFMLVVDAAGWHMSLGTNDAFTFIKGMVSTDSDHYPERLGNVVIINAPFVLSWAWGIVQTFLDPVTKAKIKITSRPSEWKPLLQQYIDVDQIPKQYGGHAADPTADEAILSMNPVEEEQTEEVEVVQVVQGLDKLSLSMATNTSGKDGNSSTNSNASTEDSENSEMIMQQSNQ